MKDKERSMCVPLRINARPRLLFPILVALTVGAAMLLSVTMESGTAAAATNKTRPEPRYHDPDATIDKAIEEMRPGVETAFATEMHLSRSWGKDTLEKLPGKFSESDLPQWLRALKEFGVKQQIKATDSWLQNAANKRLDGHMRILIDRFTLWMLRRNLRSTLRMKAQSAESTDKAIALFKDAAILGGNNGSPSPGDSAPSDKGRAILSGKDEQGNYKWYNIVKSDGEIMVHDAQAPDPKSGKGYFYLLDEREFPKLKDVKITIFSKEMDKEIERMTWQKIVADSTHPESLARKKYNPEPEAAAVGESPDPSDPQPSRPEKVKEKVKEKAKKFFSKFGSRSSRSRQVRANTANGAP